MCVECGEGRRPVSHTPPYAGNVNECAADGQIEARGGVGSTSALRLSGGPKQKFRAANPTVITGEACDCPEPTAPTTPGVVLDPFGGTGTTALVAHALGRHGISVDMSADYCRLAGWRTTDPKQLAKAARKPYTPPAEQLDGQMTLIDVEESA